MTFCEAEGIDYIFGLPTNAVLRAAIEGAEAQAPVLRRYAETRYGARPWGKQRRVPSMAQTMNT